MSLSVKTRFEVFKRDSFTCQYCGKKAPEVVLHLDHIKPKADGGDDAIINLITSCSDCNLGKGAKPLSDQTAISKQVEQMAQLQQRREQLEMLMQWRDGLQSIEKDKVEYFGKRFETLTGFSLSAAGKLAVEKLFKKYPIDLVMDSLEDSASEYLSISRSGGNTRESVEKVFKKVERIAYYKKQDIDKPYLGKLRYVKGILRNRLDLGWNEQDDVFRFLQAAYLKGISIDDLKALALRVSTMEELLDFFASALDEDHPHV